MTSYEISSPVADVVAISAEVQADGGLYSGVALTGLTAVSSTGTSASVDNTTATSNGALANLHVTDNTRDGATTIKVQDSADGLAWADLITFTSVSASATVGESITSTGTVNRYLRAEHTLAGSSGSVTFHVSVARR
jgi:hypothetical protein